MTRKKVTTTSLRARKAKGPKIAMVTAYDATMAALLDEGGVDALLVGDSLGMVVQGRSDTLSVTLEEMAYHCRAVCRARPAAHVVCDLPFLSYQVTPEEALRSAGYLVKEGRAESVKLEGGTEMAASVRKIVDAGVPVMGHVGLTPQSIHHMGGFRVQGKTEEAARELVDDVKALEDAGAYAIVIEGVPSDVAALLTETVSVPTIGIGAGPATDGQVLVCYDLLGMYGEVSSKFVKRFRETGSDITNAIGEYVNEVRTGAFPKPEHGFSMATGEHVPEDDGGS